MRLRISRDDGGFLLTYRGYSDTWYDRALGRFGAVCAAAVALCPTTAPDPALRLAWWSVGLRTIHYVAAFALFLAFILFALWLFRRSGVPRGQPLPPDKLLRNRVYLLCGLIMVGSVIWAGSSLIWHQPIFLPETLALWAFAVSWLIKGRSPETLLAVASRAKAAVR